MYIGEIGRRVGEGFRANLLWQDPKRNVKDSFKPFARLLTETSQPF